MKRRKEILFFSAAQIAGIIAEEFPEMYSIVRVSENTESLKESLEGYIARCEQSTSVKDEYSIRQAHAAATHMREMMRWQGGVLTDLSTGETITPDTFGILRTAILEAGKGASPDFLMDIYHTLCSLEGRTASPASRERAKRYARRWESGLEKEIIALRDENRNRISGLLIEKIEQRSPQHKRFWFSEGTTRQQKQAMIDVWWNDFRFHLAMAIRSPRELNKFLDGSIPTVVMRRLQQAKAKDMPFFITPYYASLLDVTGNGYDDQTIRSYVIYSRELIDAYGTIRAWEKEDLAKPGEPNAAGWMVPDAGNIHRRYPDVAILIPDSMGRGCGGLCAPCQRMYDFQNKRLNFEFSKLKPNETWDTKLRRLMRYFEKDPELRDILLTGGDALMSQNKTLQKILQAILFMSERKRKGNRFLPQGEQRIVIERVRLGTRLPAYLPMRIDDELISILSEFKRKGSKLGIKQFIIQTHFESPLEMTPDARRAIKALLSAGWLVTNQLVFTAAASRRGHTAALRRVLSQQGVIPYYTFTVKGFAENRALFAPNSRSIQEQAEEKLYGAMTSQIEEELMKIIEAPERLQRTLPQFLVRHNLPFVSTDRSVLNLPGIGKSMTFRTIGITSDGRRILLFDHDTSRPHSPVIMKIGKVCITENKPVGEYLRQLDDMGERPADYATIWQYTDSQTEPRFALFDLGQ